MVLNFLSTHEMHIAVENKWFSTIFSTNMQVVSDCFLQEQERIIRQLDTSVLLGVEVSGGTVN